MSDCMTTRLYIDGEWRDAADGAVMPVIDPATGEQVGTVAHATRSDLDAALGAVSRGFHLWSATPAFDRSRFMRRAAELLRERAHTIGRMMTIEQGKPLEEATGEVLRGADIIDWFAEEARRTYGQIIPARIPGVMQMTYKLPIGPVAAFTPWNFPINQTVRKLAAALAAGCSLIVKAAEETPASPAELVRAFSDAGVPAGVINLVYGNPSEISEYLIAHSTIRKISFTGSTPVGKKLAALAATHMKPSTMELGGHAPAIIFEDADIPAAVKMLARAKFLNAGQVCVSPTRFLVQEQVYDEFLEAFTSAAKAVKVGNGLHEGVEMGPLANERRIPALEVVVQDAVDRGATLTTGGRRIGNVGNFYEPTVLSRVPTEARLMNEEPFGPIASFNSFRTSSEAINEANRLPYGLASYVFTKSSDVIQQIGTRIEAGMVTINHVGLSLPEVPFGGIKDSGHGTEGGSEAINAYLITRFVTQGAP
ncbi:NAD-dependent succinate-semialdehyde dehydrogenase (plasmid) [Sinorhizobium medicae]|uniref:NAD-dependent succinate-semialdehyde dehydrogenase n=1 Tax=Sinorhizobium medicae TaxID=110321 RepID=UPI002AF6B2AD|nr:NAD-dependent succinate-semialdehyde dehydrogenase [Sinorhizobium medicae]WQO88789.1 NAD-dependent succinate-semialdehyde dehydrogenase [Sinorhizobium medicae]